MLLFLAGITACQDELGVTDKGKADVHSPVAVRLQFGVPSSPEIQISRADGEEDIEVSAIRIFVFDGDSYLGSDDVSNITQTGADNAYTGTVTLYEGTQTVYAVANYSGRLYWINPINELTNAAESGKSTFINTLYTMYSDLLATNVLPTLTGSNIPLSGKGEIHVTNGQLETNYRTVFLKRPYATVAFEIETIQNTNGTTKRFTPQTYTVHNAPKQSYIMEEEGNASRTTVSGEDNFYTVHTEQIGVASEGTASFSFYLPENIQDCKNSCSDFNDRDLTGEGTDETWTNAPDYGTYIVIEGQYEEETNGRVNRYGDVSYVIHLGDFSQSGSMSDFSVRRNYRYTYKMKVVGVNNIIVEATTDKEEQPSAEGDIVDLDQHSELFNLDSHYEQVYVEYNLSDIAQNIRNRIQEAEEAGETIDETRLNELIAQNFLLSISTPIDTRTSNEPIRPYSGSDEESDMKGIDYHWAQFYSQNTRNSITSYSNTTEDTMLSPWTVCKLMGDAVKQIYNNETQVSVTSLNLTTDNNGDYIAPFTIFIDEYVYTEDLSRKTIGWDRYTRQNPRTLMIASDMHISSDLNSTYSTVLTYITQTSIETFYSPASAQTTNALGIETYNEHGVIAGRSYQDRGETKYVIGFGENKEGGNGTDTGNGRKNMLTNINWVRDNQLNWDDYIDFTKVGYLSDNTNSGNIISTLDNYMTAYKACLSRNRDLNRNHKIDDDEVRWYLPAINQYLRMGIGAQSLSAEARMYTGAKSELSGGSYPADFLNNGALYYTNTESENFYWAVEVGAYGSTTGHSAQIRCVRNLAKTNLVDGDNTPIDDEALAEAVYGSAPSQLSSGNYMFNFGDRLDVSIFRMSDQEGPYRAHNEDEDANMLPQAFVVAEDYIKDRRGDAVFAYSRIWGTSTNMDPCRTYSENWDESDEGLWRTPNLSELMVMATAANIIGLENKNTYSRTQFSNQNLRHGFYYNTSGFITTSNGEIGSNGGYVRCVRDATSEEIAESE